MREDIGNLRIIVDLNDAILAAAGSDWKDWRKFDLNKIDALAADVLRARAKEALAEEFGDVGFAVVKDPRMCRLMPFWGPVFAEAKWSVRALLPIRPPLEVSQSLHCRDGIWAPPTGVCSGCATSSTPRSKPAAWRGLFWIGRNFSGNRRKALAQASEQLGAELAVLVRKRPR